MNDLPPVGAPDPLSPSSNADVPRPDERQRGLHAVDLAEGGLLADVGVLIDLASIYLPIVGMVLSPAVPMPFTLLMVRRGPRATLLAAAVAAFLVTVFAGPHFGWRMALEAGVGMLFGWAMRRRIRPTNVLILGMLLVGTAAFAASMGVIVFTGLPVSDVVGELRNGFNGAAAVFAAVGHITGLPGLWIAFLPTYRAIEATLLAFWPVLLYCTLLVSGLVVVTFYYAVANVTMRVLGYDVPPFPPQWTVRLAQFGLRTARAPWRLFSVRRPGAGGGRPTPAAQGGRTK